jgi:hypothetical protein
MSTSKLYRFKALLLCLGDTAILSRVLRPDAAVGFIVNYGGNCVPANKFIEHFVAVL